MTTKTQKEIDELQAQTLIDMSKQDIQKLDDKRREEIAKGER